MLSRYRDIFDLPHALAFVIPGYIARWPMSMRTIGCVLLIQAVSGSYGIAGATAAAMGAAQAVAGPFIARAADRRGQTIVISSTMIVQSLGLIGVIVVALAGWSDWLLLPFAVIAGVASAPITSFIRARWAYLIRCQDGADQRSLFNRAYAFESMLDESVFIFGPLIVTWLVILVAPAAGLIAAIVMLLAGRTLLLRQHASEPPHGLHHEGHHRPAISFTAVRILTACYTGIGLIFGASEVGLVAFAREQDAGWAAGLLLAIFALGSFAGAMIYGALDLKGPPSRHLQLTVTWLCVGTIPLILAPNIWVMAVVIFVTGLAIAPTFITSSTLIESLVPRSALTEGFAWTTAATVIGLSIGTAVAGVVIDRAGARPSFVVALVGASIALAICLLGARTLRTPARDAADSTTSMDAGAGNIASSPSPGGER